MNINHFSTPLSQAIILFAHGSSQSTWRAPFDIHIVPLFFGVGKHIAQDLHGIVDDVCAQHPQVRIQIAAALGQSEFMRQAMAEYAFQALHDS